MNLLRGQVEQTSEDKYFKEIIAFAIYISGK